MILFDADELRRVTLDHIRSGGSGVRFRELVDEHLAAGVSYRQLYDALMVLLDEIRDRDDEAEDEALCDQLDYLWYRIPPEDLP